MHHRFGKFLLTLAMLGSAFQAQPDVLVELYTSQGCVDCPAADLLASQLATHTDLAILGFHVDYWDYLGWPDSYAKPEFTERQRRYQQDHKSKSLFTPQIVINGNYSFSGNDSEAVLDGIEAARAAARVTLETRTKDDGTFQVKITPIMPHNGNLEVILAETLPLQSVDITEGENAGKFIDYVNIVTNLEKLGVWETDAAAEYTLQLDAEKNYTIFAQNLETNEIWFAQKLKAN